MTLPPYPEYKASGVDWLGDIPAHWEPPPLYGEYEERQVKNTGLVENTVLSLSYGRIIVKPVERLHGLMPESFETYQIVEPGDIIIRPTDLQNDHTSLRVGFSHHRGIITSAYMCLRTRNELTPEYGYQVLNVFDLTKTIYGYGSGLRQNLSFDDLKRVRIPLPPPDEQAAIVRFLDAAEARIRRYIRAKQKLIRLLNEQKQAIIQQAVTRGLDPSVPMKDSGVEWLGEIPAHWEVVALRYRYRAELGKMLDAKRFTDSYAVPYLRNKDVQWGSINVNDLPVMDISPDEYDRYTLKAGDLLVCEGGDVGRSAFWDGKIDVCGYQKALHRVRVTDRNRDLPRFLYYIMYTVSKLGVFVADGSENTIAHLTNEKLRAYRFPFPPYEEQLYIVDYLENKLPQIEQSIGHFQNQIDLIREYRTRLIADVVTGKVDVRGLAFEMPEAFDDDTLPDLDEDELLEEDELEDISDAE